MFEKENLYAFNHLPLAVVLLSKYKAIQILKREVHIL